MRIIKTYVSNDGREFRNRLDALNHERFVRCEDNRQLRQRIREERERTKMSARQAKKQEIDNRFKERLIRVLGESINPAITLIVQNRSEIRRVLTRRS